MRTLARREHVLLIAALWVAAGTVYAVARVRPHLRRTGKLELQAGVFERQLAGAPWPAPRGEPRNLAPRRDARADEVAAARAELARVEARFASCAGSAAGDRLRLEISALAARHGVRFEENVPCPAAELREFAGPAAGGPAERRVRFLALGEPYGLRARRLRLAGGFAGLVGFLDDLARLDHAVLVLRFEVVAGGASLVLVL